MFINRVFVKGYGFILSTPSLHEAEEAVRQLKEKYNLKGCIIGDNIMFR
ncbi:MAG: hypothetical protein J5929_01960 [Eubacterium sp.]|nr:hypothetical protein [Eubacterium sp.]